MRSSLVFIAALHAAASAAQGLELKWGLSPDEVRSKVKGGRCGEVDCSQVVSCFSGDVLLAGIPARAVFRFDGCKLSESEYKLLAVTEKQVQELKQLLAEKYGPAITPPREVHDELRYIGRERPQTFYLHKPSKTLVVVSLFEEPNRAVLVQYFEYDRFTAAIKAREEKQRRELEMSREEKKKSL